MTAKRKAGLGGTAQKQKNAKSDLEKKRDEVAAKINGIYKTAQDKVKKKLADLETQSMKRFDDGNAKATKAFEDNVNRELDAFKDDRYSGLFGWARKAKDWLLGMDDLPEVKAIFDRNRATFVVDHRQAGGRHQRRQQARDPGMQGRARHAPRPRSRTTSTSSGPALKDIGKKTAGEVNRQLDEMDGFIRKKEEELQQKLADKQQAAIKAIDEKIEKMKDAMAGALAKLGKLLLWAAKKFFTWALEKFGYSLGEIEGIINKGVAVLKAIFTKPIVFVKNLMNAAITGFKNFGKNFLKHLKDALFEWLTGSLEGVKLPTTWDLKGIVGLALQMIGISYAEHPQAHGHGHGRTGGGRPGEGLHAGEDADHRRPDGRLGAAQGNGRRDARRLRRRGEGLHQDRRSSSRRSSGSSACSSPAPASSRPSSASTTRSCSSSRRPSRSRR